MIARETRADPSFAEIVRRWGRIGCLGFGGPPAHIALFRELCVERERWLTDASFERAVAATNLLPGPASTQLAIYCAWRLRGPRGALLGGLCFVLPGLIIMLALSALFLSGSPPPWLRGAGMGAGAAVAAVAVRAGLGLAAPIWRRAAGRERPRVLLYGLAAGAVAAAAGPALVLVLLACGAAELAWRAQARQRIAPAAWPLLARGHLSGVLHAKAPLSGLILRTPLIGAAAEGGTGALLWTALKVGALAFGGGFVIVPLMQSDAVSTYHWMTNAQFLNAVALGQITPGPVTQTVAAVGYAAGGLAGGLFAALVAFAPSFAFILLGAARFERLLVNERVLGFLAGAAPAAAGAIIGSSIPLAGAIGERWQYVVLAAAAVALLALRRPVVMTLLAAGGAGALAGLLGAPITPG
jgi:chromate transporter